MALLCPIHLPLLSQLRKGLVYIFLLARLCVFLYMCLFFFHSREGEKKGGQRCLFVTVDGLAVNLSKMFSCLLNSSS